MIPSGGDPEAVTYDGDAPLLSCAMTGAGKGRGVLIPNMLPIPAHDAVDIKGELYQVTSRRRREMGQQVRTGPVSPRNGPKRQPESV